MLNVLALVAAAVALDSAAVYSETLSIKPLANAMLLTQFEFAAQQPLETQTHYTLFPRTLGQILAQTNTNELHLRFSQGWWDHESWGTEPNGGDAAGGIGVELWAYVEGRTPLEAHENWYRLAHSLSGLFCASLNFIDEQNTAILETESGYLFRGALPGEPVCTENLTPFIKLLPCKGWSGIAALLDGHSLFDSQWQTMALDVKRSDAYQFNQSITSVMNVPRLLSRHVNPLPKPLPRSELNCKPGWPGCLPQKDEHATWDLASLFGKTVDGPCPLGTSFVKFEAPQWTINGEHNEQFEITGPTPLVIAGKSAEVAETRRPPIGVDRSFTGTGQQSGGVRIVFTNNKNETTSLTYHEVLPWYMRIYLHTLQDIDGVVKDLRYSGANLRGRPTQLDFELELPAQSQISIEYSFDKSLLFIEEYPPDANHGFEIAPGVAVDSSGYVTRTTSLLLSLPVPDFSMPYNVIILTCTSLTLMISNILNMLIKVVIPEPVGERYAKGLLGQVIDKVNAQFRRLKPKNKLK